jgi:hypothetical protein
MRQQSGLGTGLDDAANTALAHFGTGLRALRAVGAVTQQEFGEWMGRARDASGWDPATVLRQRASTVTYRGITSLHQEDPPFPQFLRLVAAPNEEHELHGGRIRIIGVELFDSEMALHWRMAPPPDLDLAFPEVAAAEDQEMAGLPEEERAAFRRSRVNRSWHVLGSFEVMDDVGNRYKSLASFGSAGNIMVGRHIITPAL